MKRLIIFVLIMTGIAAFSAAQTAEPFRQEGLASWYNSSFEGKSTAYGEFYNSGLYTAAHKTLPHNTYVTVTNKQNNRKVTVRVNDRGPFVTARIIDLSRAAAEALDMIVTGTAPVIVELAANTALGPVQDLPQSAPQAAPVLAVPAAPAAPAMTLIPAAPAAVAATPAAPNEIPVPAAVPPSSAQPAQPQAAPAAPTMTLIPVAPAAAVPSAIIAAPTPQLVPRSPQIAPQAAPQTVAPPRPIPAAPPVVSASAMIPAPPAQIKGSLPPAGSSKLYRLQVGAYTIPRNANEAFDKLKTAGLSPLFERYGAFYRVVLPKLEAAEIPRIAEILGNAGFPEAVIREETGY